MQDREKIPDLMMPESMTRFVFDNMGNQLSTKKIADTMTSNYVDGLMESFYRDVAFHFHASYN